MQARIKFFAFSKKQVYKRFQCLFNHIWGSHPKIIAGTKPGTEIPYQEIAEEQGLEKIDRIPGISTAIGIIRFFSIVIFVSKFSSSTLGCYSYSPYFCIRSWLIDNINPSNIDLKNKRPNPENPKNPISVNFFSFVWFARLYFSCSIFLQND